MKVIYIHARPQGHPLHHKYGMSVACADIFRDFKIRWHDVNVPAWKRYLSWIVCAFAFPGKRKYDVFYSDGLVYFLVIMRKIRLISKRQKLIGLIDDETLYFLITGKYSSVASRLIKYTINSYDGFVCVGDFETRLIKQVLKKELPIETVFNGVSEQRIKYLSEITYNPRSGKIVFIGSITNDNRAYYKGLNFLLNLFERLLSDGNELELYIIGDNTEEIVSKYSSVIGRTARNHVHWTGKVDDLQPYLNDSLFYLHCSNGESWGISVQEAMFAGVVPFVSDLTGVSQVVKEVSHKLVFETNNLTNALERVRWFIQLNENEKEELSRQCRLVVSKYSEENAIAKFQHAFKNLAKG
jgi:glycosyltransferase involved in cell wall biosynthesis